MRESRSFPFTLGSCYDAHGEGKSLVIWWLFSGQHLKSGPGSDLCSPVEAYMPVPNFLLNAFSCTTPVMTSSPVSPHLQRLQPNPQVMADLNKQLVLLLWCLNFSTLSPTSHTPASRAYQVARRHLLALQTKLWHCLASACLWANPLPSLLLWAMLLPAISCHHAPCEPQSRNATELFSCPTHSSPSALGSSIRPSLAAWIAFGSCSRQK